MRPTWGASLGTSLALAAALAYAQDVPKPRLAPAKPAPAAVQFFETKIRPLLLQRCAACHGEKLQKAGLRLDLAAGFRKGGDSGPLVNAADPEQSLLLRAVRYEGDTRMPPQGKLTPAQVADLTTWVRAGAPWPAAAPNSQLETPNSKLAQAPFWSFQPVKPVPVPAVKNRAWVKNPIDAFILAKLEAKGLQPAPPASRRELIRRAYFDLIGLPPTPEETEAFEKDTAPDAYERLIDKLLALPQYGERWGRHWLDVVRFAQTNGYERDAEKPNAWRYRDYVIKSFNDDKPYDRFLKEQLAGDELDDVSDDTLIATGYYRLGVWDDEPDDARQAEFDNLDDMLSTTGQAFLGLTVGCARCHDHKFDPIAQDEYYGLLAFLRNIRKYELPEKAAPNTVFTELKAGGQALAIRETGPTAPPTHILLRGSAATPAAEVKPHFIQALCPSKEAAYPVLPTASATSTGRRRVLAEWLASKDHPLTARVLVNRLWQHHFGRGLVSTPNDFGHTGIAPTHPELLDWLASAFSQGVGHRVQGLGPNRTQGQAPSVNGSGFGLDPRPYTLSPGSPWSIKAIHRLIMLSSAYRQSSRATLAMGHEVDADNTLLWHQNLRRLEAEAIRDAMLSASGTLNPQMGGRGFFPKLPQEVLNTQSRPGNGWDTSSETERARRSVYIFSKRTLGVPFLESFDAPTPDSSVAARPTTTIAPQALILLNGSFMEEQSAAFAERLLRECGPDAGKNIDRAFRLALSRAPTAREARVAQEYLDQQRARVPQLPAAEAYRKSLAALCKVILNLNEFVYVD